MTLASAGAVLAYIPSPDQGVWYLGPVPIRAYALCIIAGIIIAVVWGERRFVARGGLAGTVTDVAVYAVPFGLVGGRLYHVATDWRTYFGPGGNPIKALEIWEGGLGIWGAVALGAVGAWIGCRRRGVPLPFFADAVAPGIVVAQAVGRLGNYFNQELYGAPTDLPWGLEIFRRVDPATGLADPLGGVVLDHTPVEVVHPTFLYELLINLVVAALVVWADKRFRLGHGRAFAVYVAGYTLGRFFVEQMRTDQATRVFGDIRINTVVSAVVFVAAIAYFVLAPKGREEPPVTDAEADVDGAVPQDATPGPDLRKGAGRPSGVPAGATATKVGGAEAATAVLETEQATTYIEREPATRPDTEPDSRPDSRPDAEPAPEQATEVIAREPAPSVFAATEQDTEVLRVPSAEAAGTAPAEAAPAESDESPDRAADAEPAPEEPEPVVPEPVAEAPEPESDKAEPVVEKPEPASEKPEPVSEKAEPVVEKPESTTAEKPATAEQPEAAGETRPTGGAEPAEPVADKTDEPAEARPAAGEPDGEQPAPTVAEAGPEPTAPEPAAAQAPAADEPVVGEQAAEKAGPAVTAVPEGDDKPSGSTAGAPTGANGSRAEGNPDDQPDDEDRPVEPRVGAERREE